MLSFPRSRNRRVDLQDVLARIDREGAATRLSLAESTALVASRTMDAHDTPRTAANRVHMQLCRALQAGAGQPSPPDDGTCLVEGADKRIPVDELIRWAALRYGYESFNGLPRKPRVIGVAINETLGMSAIADAVVLPASPERKDEAILRWITQALAQERRAVAAEREAEAVKAELRRRDELGARFRSNK